MKADVTKKRKSDFSLRSFAFHCGSVGVLNQDPLRPAFGGLPGGGNGKSAIFSRKTRTRKIGASASTATANAVPAEFNLSIDRKKGRFLGLFCRKTGVPRKIFHTVFCVFPIFWDFIRRKLLSMNDKRLSDPSKKNRA